MKKLFNIFTKTIIFLLFMLILYILLWTIITSKYGIFSITKFSKIYLLLGSSLLLLIIYFVNKKLNKFDNKKLKIFNYILIAILLILQIFLFINFNIEQKTDPFYVNDYSISIANGHDTIVDNNWSDYFQRYKNNNFVLLFTIKLIKVANIFNINNYSKFLVIVNMLLIDLSILFTYLIAKEEKDKKFASLVLFLSILNPINYLMMFWTYTPTYSLPFTTLLILLWIKLHKKDNKYLIYALLFGIVTATGYLMRPTLVIPLTAIFIIFVYELLSKKIKVNKKLGYILLVIFISLICSYYTCNRYINKYVHGQENAFPLTHWIMVGLKGNGTIKEKYNDFTLSYETYDEKKEATTKEIIKTLKEYKVFGTIKHIMKKIPETWNDETANKMTRKKEDRSPNNLYNYVVGDKSDLLKLYCQAFRIVTYICILVFLFKSFFDKKYLFIDFYSLTIFGAILFYIIWEAKDAYSIPFLPILLILEGNGLQNIRIKDKIINKSILVIIAITLLLSIIDINNFTKKKYLHKDYSIIVTNYSGREGINNIIKNDKIVTQEFYSNEPYNTIELVSKKINNNDSKYKIKLLDGKEIVYTVLVSSENIKDDILKIEIPKTITNKNKKKYKLEINKYEGSEDSIEWYYNKSKMLDSYDGNLLLDNNTYKNDLSMNVYYLNNKDSYTTKGKYIITKLIIILLEISFYILYNKKNKASE